MHEHRHHDHQLDDRRQRRRTPASRTRGGMLARPSSTVSVQNSIVASNTACQPTQQPPTAGSRVRGTITSLGHNLETGTTAASRRPAISRTPTRSSSCIRRVIADYGGNTDTFALPANSPAVDAVPAGSPGCSGTDQRDIARPQGALATSARTSVVPAGRGPAVHTRCSASNRPRPRATIDWGDGTSAVGRQCRPDDARSHRDTHLHRGRHLPRDDPLRSTATASPSTPVRHQGRRRAADLRRQPVNPIAGVSFTGPVATFTGRQSIRQGLGLQSPRSPGATARRHRRASSPPARAVASWSPARTRTPRPAPTDHHDCDHRRRWRVHDRARHRNRRRRPSQVVYRAAAA